MKYILRQTNINTGRIHYQQTRGLWVLDRTEAKRYTLQEAQVEYGYCVFVQVGSLYILELIPDLPTDPLRVPENWFQNRYGAWEYRGPGSGPWLIPVRKESV